MTFAMPFAEKKVLKDESDWKSQIGTSRMQATLKNDP